MTDGHEKEANPAVTTPIFEEDDEPTTTAETPTSKKKIAGGSSSRLSLLERLAEYVMEKDLSWEDSNDDGQEEED